MNRKNSPKHCCCIAGGSIRDVARHRQSILFNGDTVLCDFVVRRATRTYIRVGMVSDRGLSLRIRLWDGSRLLERRFYHRRNCTARCGTADMLVFVVWRNSRPCARRTTGLDTAVKLGCRRKRVH